jgi:AraC family transcriptional regulator of arabinose operon
VNALDTPYFPPPDGLWIDRLVFTPGNVTYRQRGTPDCLIMIGVDGCGILRHERGERNMGRGDVVLLMPDAPHHYGSESTSWEVVWSHFVPTAELAAHLAWPELSTGVRFLHIDDPNLEEIANAMKRGHERLQRGSTLSHELAANALNEALLLCDVANPLRGAWDSRIRMAIDFLCRHLDRPVRIDEVARSTGLSTSRISRLFRQQTGTSIQQFLEGRRLEMARQRLSLTDQPISRISTDLGFSNPFYFSRRFTKCFKRSPSEYRLQARRQKTKRT